jgi:hypothetical protein
LETDGTTKIAQCASTTTIPRRTFVFYCGWLEEMIPESIAAHTGSSSLSGEGQILWLDFESYATGAFTYWLSPGHRR